MIRLLDELGQALGGPPTVLMGKKALHLNRTALVCTVEIGMNWSELAQHLAEHGLLPAPVPPSSKTRSVGELLQQPLPAEAAPFSGRFADGCLTFTAKLGAGTSFSPSPSPRRAVGPDLVYAVVGGQGHVAALETATLRAWTKGERQERVARSFPSFAEALNAARQLLVMGALPWNLWVSPQGILVAELSGLPDLVTATLQKFEAVGRAADVVELPAQLDTGRCLNFDEVPTVGSGTRTKEWAVGWHRRGFALCAEQKP